MAVKNYTSIQKMKQFAIDEIAPKYFNIDEVNDLNIGLLGFTTEYIGTIAEDAFNTVLMYMNEMFPHLAVMPETIYNNATLFQIDGSFATASSTSIYLFIPESTILTYGSKPDDDKISSFYLDSDMIINIEDLHFMPDYDIKINYKETINNDYIFTAKYIKEKYGSRYNNTISNIEDPYIRLKRINYENTKFLQLEIQAHQVDKFLTMETIVNNDIINSPTINIEFDGSLANFEIFYKSPGEKNYVQLTKLMSGSVPTSNNDFCYYKMVDDNELEITFTTRDGYFSPAYNSEILIEYYITEGANGNFDSYTGDNINVIASSEKYQYNNNISLFAIAISGAYNGADKMSINELKNMTVERFSTVGSYSTENDLQLYFNNFNENFNSNILFLKTRDDLFERIFSAFTLFKDKNNNILSTNTLDIVSLVPGTSPTGDFDTETEQSDIYILKPGHIFTYASDSSASVKIQQGADNMITDDNLPDEDFVYTNPFLIYFSKSPTTVGYFMTSVNNSYSLYYENAYDTSIVQFICKNLNITRNSITGDNTDEYKLSLVVTPTTTLDNPMVDDEGNITNTIKVKLKFTNENGEENEFYKYMELSDYDLSLGIYTFSTILTTDDYITSNNVRITNFNDGSTSGLIPMTNEIINIYIYYDDEMTNKYSTKSYPVTFVEPIEMIHSTGLYIDNSDTVDESDYLITIKSVPLIKASLMQDSKNATEFYNLMKNQYNYLNNIIQKITNNFSIDIKFYNTYGMSKNFYVEDLTSELINRVNISIKFKIDLVYGVDTEEVVNEIKAFIKNYIESINDNGTNSIYISNLIRELENNFSEINYLKFVGINNYSSSVQAIENKTMDLSALTKSQRLNYIPEYLTLALDDINIELI